ncbi:hypothetical protein [Pyxidicoccus caerfyrddinensis]|uniref:hypothetical protein n=1 Tax=Pyxidicoccus caerfyrddinensis TaxID=2709663 RepID=UPI0013DB4C83|nr:hypothetical protein [Pyxidicoccus caerfyrddinensis]
MEFEWQPEVDALDIVPEKFRGLYAKGEGEGAKYTLDADMVKRLDNSSLTTALKKERDSSKELKALVSAYQKLAKTPEEAEKLVGDLRTQVAEAQKGKDGAATWEKQRTELESGHAKALGEKEAALESMRTALHKRLVHSEALAAITDAKGSASLLLPYVERYVKVVEEDGDFLVRIVDAKGEPREHKTGGYVTTREFVAELKKNPDFARAFEGTGSSGSGMRPGGKTGGTPGSDTLSPLQRIARGLADRK